MAQANITGPQIMSSMKSVQSFEKRTQVNIPGLHVVELSHLCDMEMRTFKYKWRKRRYFFTKVTISPAERLNWLPDLHLTMSIVLHYEHNNFSCNLIINVQ